MGKLGKIFTIIILVVVVVIAGLIAFVHFYLTEERVKALVIPQAEAALGREVAIGSIKIGLMSGITIQNFLVKEADKETPFVSTRAFVLSYKLLPLLQKKLIISEIRFDEPTVRIMRDKEGKFNFSTLAFLATEPSPQNAKTGQQKPAAAAMPLALTINQINLNNAHVKIHDQLGEIPEIDTTASAKFNIDLGHTMQNLQYNGSFNFSAEISHDAVQTKLNGKGSMTQKDMNIVVDTDLDNELVHTEADVKNFMQGPDATIALSSKSLNVDKLLGIIAGLPGTKEEKPQKITSAANASGAVIADSLPTGLVAHGSVKVDQAVYNRIAAEDFLLTFELAQGILTIKELSAKAYGGRLASNMTVDLNQPGPAYDGKLELQSMQSADLSKALVQKLAGMLSGSLQSAMTFSGAGTSWPQISKVLTADGSFSLADGGIKGTPISTAVANLLGLQELHNISYKNISGTFTIVKGGKAKIKTNLRGPDITAEAEGIVGLDGSLDLPVTLHLAPPLADKLKARAAFTKYLTDEQGATTLHLKLAGSLKRPQPTLDLMNVKEQLQKTLQDKIFNKSGSANPDNDKNTSPESIIKGLFSR